MPASEPKGEAGIDHEYTREITCPHCGWVGGDSWERDDSGTEDDCAGCGLGFAWERHTEVTYVTKATGGRDAD